MWMAISVLLGFLLLLSWALLALIFGMTRQGRPWRARARWLTSLAGVVLALGVFMLEPQYFPPEPHLQWLAVSLMALLIGEGSLFLLGSLMARVLRRFEERAEERKAGYTTKTK